MPFSEGGCNLPPPIAAPYPRILRLLAILSLGVISIAVVTNFFHPFHMDFISFWAAAVITLQGHPADAYVPELLASVQRQAMPMGTDMPFGYPPPFLLFILPVGFLSYGIAAALWIAVSFVAYHLAARRLMPGFGAASAAFAPAMICSVVGQSALMLTSLIFVAFTLLPTAPFAAGMLLGCLILKPQLALLVPIALLADRNWHALLGAVFSACALLLLALLFFGPETYSAFLASIVRSSAIVTQGLVGWHKMAGVYPALRLAGTPQWIAWSVHLVVAILATAGMCWIWRKHTDPLLRGAVFAAATMLASPYLYLYDMAALLMAFAWLVQQRAPTPLLAVLWLVPLIGFVQSWLPDIPINIAPILSVSLLILIYRYRPAPPLKSGPGIDSGSLGR